MADFIGAVLAAIVIMFFIAFVALMGMSHMATENEAVVAKQFCKPICTSDEDATAKFNGATKSFDCFCTRPLYSVNGGK